MNFFLGGGVFWEFGLGVGGGKGWILVFLYRKFFLLSKVIDIFL